MGKRATAVLAYPILCIVALYASLGLMGSPAGDLYRRPAPFVATIVLAAATLLLLTLWHARPILPTLRSLPFHLHIGWGLVLLAVLLRFALNEFIPLPEHTFEEWNRAAQAFKVVHDGSFTLDHRMADLWNSISVRFADGSITAIRVPLRVLGTLSVLVLGLALWKAGAGWPAILFGVFVMASLRWLVMTGSVVTETAVDVLPQTLLILCMVGVFKSSSGRWLWAAAAGFVAGLMLYGFPGYRMAVCAAFAVPVVHGFTAGSEHFRRLMLGVAAAFLLFMLLTGAPALAEVLNRDTSGHVHYDWIHRHVREHRLNTDLLLNEGFMPWLVSEASDYWNYAAALFGMGDPHVDRRFTHPDRTAIPLAVGLIFLMGTLHALFRPMAGGLNRSLACFMLLALLIVAVAPGNMDFARLSPLVAILPFLSALMLDDLMRAIVRWRPNWTGAAALCLLLLTLALSLVNVSAVLRQYADPDTINTYTQRKENACRLVGLHPENFDTYYVFNGDCNITHSRWVYDGRTFDDRARNQLSLHDVLPTPTPRTLYLLVENGDISRDMRAAFVDIAEQLGSADTMVTHHDSQDRLIGMAFCHRCETEQRP